jgi:hypothetical protein
MFSDYQVVSIKTHTTFFAIYILVDESTYVFGRWWSFSAPDLEQSLTKAKKGIMAVTHYI